jgi:hyaluronoglucosaminidase
VANKYWGVVEGFYRKPYSFDQRKDLIKFISDIELNTYVYGPKEDPYHRKKYKSPYPSSRLKEFAVLNELANRYHVHFVYALSPGARPDPRAINKKFRQLLSVGVNKFAIFYDDINTERDKRTADIQAQTANGLYEILIAKTTNPSVFLCPTQYYGFKSTEYLLAMSRKLNPKIAMMWTGKRVVSHRITEIQVDRIKDLTGRRPLIWDNFFANDYLPQGALIRIPYRFRQPGIVGKTMGILINPMNQYQDSKRAIYTAAKFFNDPYRYDPQKAWREAGRLFRRPPYS